MSPIDRRRFLRLLGGAAAAAMLGLAGCSRDQQGTTIAPAASSTVPEPTTATTTTTTTPPPARTPAGTLDALHAVGQAYLLAQSTERSVDALATALGLDPGNLAGLRSRLPEFAATIRDDFAADRAVTADGWRLAVTEGRVAALLFLSE